MDQQALDKLQNIRADKKTFAQLSIGDTFDFIDMSRPMFNSFYRRCVKTSTRKYETIDAPVMQCRVGSVSARVYHVADGRDLAVAKQSLMHAADHLMSQYNPIETIGHSHYCYSGDLKAVDLLRKFGE